MIYKYKFGLDVIHFGHISHDHKGSSKDLFLQLDNEFDPNDAEYSFHNISMMRNKQIQNRIQHFSLNCNESFDRIASLYFLLIFIFVFSWSFGVFFPVFWGRKMEHAIFEKLRFWAF